MFTIIAGVIGLGIAVALLIVGANYLGTAYTNSTAKSNATALANFGQQVQGAVQLFAIDKSADPIDLAALTTPDATTGTTYLANVPVFKFAGASTLASGVLSVATVAKGACDQMKNIGGNVGAAAADVTKFGCHSVTSTGTNDTGTFLYRVK